MQFVVLLWNTCMVYFCAYFLTIGLLRRSTRIWFYMLSTDCIYYCFPGCHLHVWRTAMYMYICFGDMVQPARTISLMDHTFDDKVPPPVP